MKTPERTNPPPHTTVTVTHDGAGWHYRELRAGATIREAVYLDWHRVERWVQLFSLAAQPADRPADDGRARPLGPPTVI